MPDICGDQESLSPYENDIEYLKDELKRLDLMLDLMVRRAGRRANDPLRGMYVSDEEAASLLAEDEHDPSKAEEEACNGSREACEALASIEIRLQQGHEAGFEPAHAEDGKESRPLSGRDGCSRLLCLCGAGPEIRKDLRLSSRRS